MKQTDMEEGHCGTYLRLISASSGPRVSVTKICGDKTKMYSTTEEDHCDLAEIYIFFFSSLYVLATLTRGPDDALVSLR